MTQLAFAILVAAPAFAAPNLTITGACPGVASVTATGLTPGGNTAILKGNAPGGDVIPAGPCAGRQTGLSNLALVNVVPDNNNDGMFTANPNVPAQMCGTDIQFLDLRSCQLSNIQRLGGGGGSCTPSGARAPFDALMTDGAGGCWSTNVCQFGTYGWDGDGQSFITGSDEITCGGTTACVGNVGITTYESAGYCQGHWAVMCDGVQVGQIDTTGRACIGDAMTNGCSTSFAPVTCSQITLTAVLVGDEPRGCCGQDGPDSMITAVSAW